jgi:predicted NBD/HSP70 family sugar kinase
MPPGPTPRPSTTRLLLDLVRTAGTLSRVELAEVTGLTAGTITNVVRDLILGGLVHEVGRSPSARGTPRRLIQINPEAGFAVGVQLDRCTTTVVLVDFAGRTLATIGLPGAGQGSPPDTLGALAEQIDGLLAGAGVGRDRVLGVGLVTHGPQDRDRGTLLTTQPTPQWREYPLTRTLSEALAVPVLLENDATAAAIGEQWAGAVPTATFGVLYMASGIGGGVVVDGEVYRGRASNTIEIGHVSMDPAGVPCACGNRGCLEAMAGPSAIVAQAVRNQDLVARLSLHGGLDETLADFEHLARAALRGDDDAHALLAESAHQLGQAAVTLVNLFDLDTIVLAGSAFSTAGPQYRDQVARALSQYSLSRELSPARALLSANTATAAAVGGALRVLRSSPTARGRLPLNSKHHPALSRVRASGAGPNRA